MRVVVAILMLATGLQAGLPTLGPLRVERYEAPTSQLPLGLSLWSGPAPIGSALNLVVASEGYTADELSRFPLDAQRIRTVWESIEPYKSRKADINWWFYIAVSQESGASRPGAPRNTAFGVTYGYQGIQRLMAPGYLARGIIWKGVEKTFPKFDSYQVLFVVNDAEYGGGGGWCMLASTTYKDGENISGWIAAHESGHTVFWLEDEYPIGPGYYQPAANVQFAASAKFPLQIEPGRWKSSDRCLMFKLTHPEFCAVCLEAATAELDRLTHRTP